LLLFTLFYHFFKINIFDVIVRFYNYLINKFIGNNSYLFSFYYFEIAV